MKNKILVVDDEPQIRETISDILGDEGYGCVLACDGEEAEKKVMIEDIDAVVLDVMLPKKGGLDLLDAIHKDFPLVPVIIMSGHGNIKMAVDAMRRRARLHREAAVMDVSWRPSGTPSALKNSRPKITISVRGSRNR